IFDRTLHSFPHDALPICSGQLKFESIVLSDNHARLYGGTTVVVGCTEMRMRFEQTVVSVHSRYTHIYVEDQGGWRMVSAQGTQRSEEHTSELQSRGQLVC